MYSMVGFQTKMKWPEQRRVFAMIPGLENADFFRFGSIHRNTYLNSPQVLTPDLSFRANRRIFAAGQITGVEGYVESAAIGLLAGRFAVGRCQGRSPAPPPRGTVLGALLNYVTSGPLGKFEPMNANLGLLPPTEKRRGEGKEQRHIRQCDAARLEFKQYLASH
jgi:methylenetetrahydrofolate--tRNA-(uracil-5-)-methyltransferase